MKVGVVGLAAVSERFSAGTSYEELVTCEAVLIAVRGSRVVILGVAYKPGVGDLRESPAIMGLLARSGADLAFHDDHVPELPEFGLRSEPLDAALAGADVAVIVTAHPGLDVEAVVRSAPLVVDFRGVTRGIEAANLVRL